MSFRTTTSRPRLSDALSGPRLTWLDRCQRLLDQREAAPYFID